MLMQFSSFIMLLIITIQYAFVYVVLSQGFGVSSIVFEHYDKNYIQLSFNSNFFHLLKSIGIIITIWGYIYNHNNRII